MTKKLKALEAPASAGDHHAALNTFARFVAVKEDEAQKTKNELLILWTDYFKPPHFEKYPNLHGLFNEATKLAGAGGTKGSTDVAVADDLLAKIDEIAEIFWETKKA